MVSIETYRARIGSFQMRSMKKSFSSFNPDDFINRTETSFGFRAKLTKKQAFCSLLICLTLLSSVWMESHTEKGFERSHENEACQRQKPHQNKEDNILNSTVHEEVLKVQLLIGNIEANPGPVNLKEFLGFLFTDTEDPCIKEVLNDFKAANDKDTNLKKLKTKKVDYLKATLAFLNDWDKDDAMIKEEIEAYTKDGIALLVLKKIYNMAPETCPTCSKTYYFKPGEYCALACVRCDRGACKECYEKEKQNLSLSYMFNKSMFFICNPCNEVISKQTRLEEHHKKKAKKIPKPTADKSNDANFETITIEEHSVEDDLVDAMDNLSVKSQPENDKSTKGVTDSENVPTECKEPEDMPEHPEGRKSEQLPEGRKENEKSQCHFYKQNICKFGISGKGCKFAHQKPCNKLLSHGLDKKRGCSEDKLCKHFHPKMCKYSLRSRLCTNLECTFFHVKGTKRYAVDAKNVKEKSFVKKTSKSTQSRNTEIPVNKSEKKKSQDFLEKTHQAPKPPQSILLESGTGYGEELKTMMNTLNQIVRIQNQQSQQMNLLMNLPAYQKPIPILQNMNHFPPSLQTVMIPNQHL